MFSIEKNKIIKYRVSDQWMTGFHLLTKKSWWIPLSQ